MEYLNIRNDYNILFTYEDYKAAGPPNFNQIVSTSVAYFLGLFIYNGFLYLLLTMFLGSVVVQSDRHDLGVSSAECTGGASTPSQ